MQVARRGKTLTRGAQKPALRLPLQHRRRDGKDILRDVGDLRVEADQRARPDRHPEGRQFAELLDIVLIQGRAFLDFDGIKRLILLDDEIDFTRIALLGPKVEDRAPITPARMLSALLSADFFAQGLIFPATGGTLW